MLFTRKSLSKLVPRFIAAALLGIPFLWANSLLEGAAIPTAAVLIGIVSTLLPDRPWRHVPAISPVLARLLLYALLAGIGLSASSIPFLRVSLVITLLILFGVSLLYRQPDPILKLASIGFGLTLALILIEIGAGFMLRRIETPVMQAAAPTPQSATATLTFTTTLIPTTAPTFTPTTAPTPTVSVFPAATQTPTLARPITGYGVVDWMTDNGQVPWGDLTGYGPRINSVAHAYMVDREGKVVYDNIVTFNGKGMRGPEPSYDKPDDVYRILVIGDSFVEAVQVDYEKTFYYLLQEQLKTHTTNKHKFEVIALGRVGWGTLQEYLYYINEGYKFHADQVILSFYINDVADNFPSFFYPDINNTNYEYSFDGDNVSITDRNQQALAPNVARRLYNGLPGILQGTNLARLLVRLGDPSPQVVTPGGVMTHIHPQFYIYVKNPQLEGYAEGWRRTKWALTHFAQAVQKNGGHFAVVSIFIGDEMIKNVSGWFPDLVKGWQWDSDLPDEKLAEILQGQPTTLIRTRPHYEEYAKQVGGEVYKLLFLPEDGHFNVVGHKVTADLLFKWLVDQNIVNDK